MDKISVIVPIYNVEKYLRQCLDSIVNQTYQNLEIILVDDGSPDNCGVICDEYARNDNRVVVIHKENCGVRAARNDGIKRATGEWITFVDSDDWCELDYYERLLSDDHEQADVICAGGYWLEYPRTKKLRSHCRTTIKVNERKAIEAMMTHITTYGLACDKLYRKDFLVIHQLFYDITSKALDDFQFNYQVFDDAACIIVKSIIGYHYRQLGTSISSGFNPNKPLEGYDVIEKMHDFTVARQLSKNVVQGVHGAALVAIKDSLSCYYFHRENKMTYMETAKAITEMKSWPRYHEAIIARNHRGMGKKLIVLQYALRSPWIWPVKMLHRLRSLITNMY